MRRFGDLCLDGAVCVLAFASLALPAVAAPSLTTLYSFQGSMDGAGPVAGLVADAGETGLYGTTQAGGAYIYGTVVALLHPGA